MVEHLTADQEVPSSNLGAPFGSVLAFRMVCLQYCENYSGRDRIVVSTLRCGRSNPGSNPGHGSSSGLLLCFCFNLPTAFLVHFLQFKSCCNNTGLVAQWITRLTTDQKIPGSTPG